jgi:bifunctional ADP-heptose synthase (sugar kinase/adenylyltransferase)
LYWYADMTRAQLSREAPLFNRPVVAETYSPGGAANVAWNLADLGVGEVHAITVLGADWRGSIFIPGMTLEKVLVRVLNPKMEDTRQEDVLQARILERGLDSLRIYLKLQRSKFVTVVLQHRA